ncbi:TIGR04255 family protein [Pasteurella multocida]|uniref:TIGR04255 family protein n=1 Tax=Pasteurella multocida TaxID=747 RepID=UPI00397DAA97
MNSVTYQKLEKQPLLFVLAEFRFPVIMQMEKYISNLQESFRTEFPYFEEQLSQEVKLQAQGFEVMSSNQWVFIDKNRRKAVIVSPYRIVCVTSDYNRFDGFSAFCLKSIDIFKKITNPAFVSRIGLRYSDLIIPIDQNSVKTFVQPTLYNVEHLDCIGKLSHKINEILFTTQQGNMMIRSLYGEHNLSVLPDANNLPIKINAVDHVCERMILDFDHIWESSEETDLMFDRDMILKKLNNMHNLSREAFWKCTTEEGRELWK